MPAPGEKSGINHPARKVSREADSTRSTITPHRRKSQDTGSGIISSSSPPSRAGIPIPDRTRLGSSSVHGSEASTSLRQAPEACGRDLSHRVPGGSWSAQLTNTPDAGFPSEESVSPKQNRSVIAPSGLTATRPTPKIDSKASHAYLSPLAQSPLRWSASGDESDDNASDRISLAVSSLAPSRRGSIAPDVDKVENNLFPVFYAYCRLRGAVFRQELSGLSKEAQTYLDQLIQGEQLIAGSAGSVGYTSAYDTAMKGLVFSRQLMSSYFDTIEARMEKGNRDEVRAIGYQLMEMTMSKFRNVLQTVEMEKELSETATVVSEMDLSVVATADHEDAPSPMPPSANKASIMKKPSLFDRLRKASLGCIAALDVSSQSSTPVATASRGPYRDSRVTLEARTLHESGIYASSPASEAPGWDYMFLSPVTSDESTQSLNIRTSLALFPEEVAKRPALSPVVEEGDVVRGKDGSIVKATVRGLIRVFTEPREMVKNDMADLIDAFFLFSPTFTTAQNLFELLIAREQVAPPRGLHEQKVIAWKVQHDCTRIHVANLICLWLESHWSKVLDDEVEDSLVTRIGSLCGRLSADRDFPVEIAHQLIDSIRRRGSWADKEKERTEANIATDVYSESLFRANLDQILSILTRPDDWNALDITAFYDDGGPELIARQLTVIEAEFFHSFQPEALIKFEDREVQRKLQEWRSFSDALTLWVIKSIVEHSDVVLRAKAATVFIAAAAVCKSMRNYSSALAIILGLTSSPITRLRQTDDSIQLCFKDMRTELDEFFHKRSNFGEYRAELPVNLPTVPLEVVIIKDIKISREVLPRVKSTAQPPVAPVEEMIPLQYYRNMRRTIRDLEKCRGEYKTLKKVDAIYDWLKHNTDELKNKHYDAYINELTQMSLKSEPKVRL
ncbi:ras GEF [Daedalea quercina L-15889]|uniref:Ras GEF n=1 Tax=Daedalea quercina L-15889 TaxID=1314783 RepID=A0A165MKF7_9APHY|nr:ras GEF [Daedalea quercina L-15889]